MTAPSPYTPPESSLAELVAPPTWADLATTGQRLTNLILDSFGTFAFAIPMTIAFEVLSPGSLEGLNEVFAGFLFTTTYYLSFELLFQRTPAKWVTGTRVVRDDGNRLTIGRAIGRTAVRYIPFEAFSFLGGQGRPIGLHDSWSKTRVVRTRGALTSGPERQGETDPALRAAIGRVKEASDRA